MDVIDELIAHCEAWEPWARVMGNVCAGDAAQALRNLRAELETEESRRHEVVRERNALRDELAVERKRVGSYRTLVFSLESQISRHRANASEAAEAIRTLDSERAANAVLTAELAAYRDALAKIGPYYVPSTELSDDEVNTMYAMIDTARKGEGE